MGLHYLLYEIGVTINLSEIFRGKVGRPRLRSARVTPGMLAP